MSARYAKGVEDDLEVRERQRVRLGGQTFTRSPAFDFCQPRLGLPATFVGGPTNRRERNQHAIILSSSSS